MAVVKIIELLGESPNSWDEAVRNAVSEASKTVRNITGVEVTNMTASVENGRISKYKADVQVAFKVDGT
ncbi:MAG TPA: dodecin domain-containing protein [Firmicutes bacterium]|nr:dodecin domain-containing protein [Bacillota bacterium]HHY98138.1 dodecin domain-containing protein [Bacillota bacterium]